MKVAVVILNWNGKAFLAQFLPSVVDCNELNAEIIVADNCSTDDSIEFLQQHYPQIRVLKNASNGGFAKGYNDALQQVTADYYVLLNSDVEVTKNWISGVINLMEKDPLIAACQPKIRSFSERSKFEYAGAAGGFIDKYGYAFCRGRILDTLEEDNGQYDDVREVFWATGACLFVRSSCFHLVGGFDADFFAHQEEIDLCWRLKNRGYKIVYSPHSTVFHVGGGTLNKTSPRKTYLNFRNNLQFLVKNHPPQFFLLKLFWRMCLDGIAGLKFLLSGQFPHFKAVVQAHGSFYRTLGKSLRKRKELKKDIVQYTTSAVYLHSIVADYYLRKKRRFSEIDFPERFKAS